MRENLLKDLRERSGLSQEQVAIKMGLQVDRSDGTARDIISKFECGITKSWGIEKIMDYCAAVGCSLNDIAVRLYPESKYSASCGYESYVDVSSLNTREYDDEPCLSSEGMNPIVDYVSERNRLIIGGSLSDRVRYGILPVIKANIEQRRNFLAILRYDEGLVDELERLQAENQLYKFKVCSSEKEMVDWVSSIHEPETVPAFAHWVLDRVPCKKEDEGKFLRLFKVAYWDGWSKNENRNKVFSMKDLIKALEEKVKRNDEFLILRDAVDYLKELDCYGAWYNANDNREYLADYLASAFWNEEKNRPRALICVVEPVVSDYLKVGLDQVVKNMLRMRHNVCEYSFFENGARPLPPFSLVIDDVFELLPEFSSVLREWLLWSRKKNDNAYRNMSVTLGVPTLQSNSISFLFCKEAAGEYFEDYIFSDGDVRAICSYDQDGLS